MNVLHYRSYSSIHSLIYKAVNKKYTHIPMILIDIEFKNLILEKRGAVDQMTHFVIVSPYLSISGLSFFPFIDFLNLYFNLVR